jgi:hypothetical protein
MSSLLEVLPASHNAEDLDHWSIHCKVERYDGFD